MRILVVVFITLMGAAWNVNGAAQLSQSISTIDSPFDLKSCWKDLAIFMSENLDEHPNVLQGSLAHPQCQTNFTLSSIGSGAQGEVYHLTLAQDLHFAVKKLHRRAIKRLGTTCPPALGNGQLEINFLTQFSSQHYHLGYYGFAMSNFETSERYDRKWRLATLYLFTEKMDRDLSKERFTLELAHQMAIALKTMHDVDYPHLDVKPENFLGNYDGEGQLTKLAIIDGGQFYKSDKNQLQPQACSLGFCPSNILDKICKSEFEHCMDLPEAKLMDLYSLAVSWLVLMKDNDGELFLGLDPKNNNLNLGKLRFRAKLLEQLAAVQAHPLAHLIVKMMAAGEQNRHKQDPITIAEVITELEGLIAQKKQAQRPSVLTVGGYLERLTLANP